MPNHHEIKITLSGSANVVAESSPILRVGDTVTYSSPSGKARVFFPAGSPYAVSKISDTHKHTVKKPGQFEFRCFITPKGKTKEVGWTPENPKAGGEHNVRPV